MKAIPIDYRETLSFSPLLLDYIEGKQSLRSFYSNKATEGGFNDKIKSRETFEHRETLVSSLLKLASPDSSEESLANIHLLKNKKTFTVTTGHQLNLFTGPLYFVFKIASTIKLTQELKAKFPDYHFVPVYWMATEDHDFEEINHTHLFKNTIRWERDAAGATGRLSTTDIQETVKAYQNILGLSSNSEKLASIVEKAYLSHDTLADATRSMVDQLFGKYGLVVIDADQAELKRLLAPIISADIVEQNSSKKVSETSKELEQNGYKAQVHARDINFFYLKDNVRERIVLNKEGEYEVLNSDISFTKETLLIEIDRHPERFSPNVIMRPLYQEVILPNLAYVGGGAEISYWLQLKSLFDYYQVEFPILIPRNSAMFVSRELSEKIFRLNFTYKSFFKDPSELKKEYVRVHSKHRLNLHDEWREFNSIFEKIKLRAHKIDPTLGPSAEAIEARLKKAIDRLEKKLLKADQKNYAEALEQIDLIKEKLFPKGVLQERVENFAPLYLKFGDRLIEELIENFQPLEFKFNVLY
ncbi:bacillithiol biosynthesis cysteine-adding enzyme BshC [Albibacterium indicum]|uniref:bacillithiol biosynthesis cysteine-adding enzyme BshC n=1 Tax=Albibacterium indicum TaxID=2292082 RepID=UPI000E4C5473|nr:bacillithiol biosynthesis cysteine-adding enzyme BshC [Pedobacter indicus]